MSRKFHAEIVEEVLRARERIYHVNGATPFQKFRVDTIDADIFLKREDLSAINAYKWRGAYNAMAVLSAAEKKRPIIAASAGNHAQGVALAARRQGLKAHIYMPLSAPKMKQDMVRKHGGDHVDIILTGDAYNDAAEAALVAAKKEKAAFIHPFDSLYTIAGQATIADEIVLSGQGPFDYAFVQIGGGGLAAGVATWLKIHYPNIKVIGVEGENQASMKASIEAGRLMTLSEIDTFCDGTAVKTPGKLTYKICRDVLDEVITVSNEEVCAAIEMAWSLDRFVPEPSGALGLAGLVKYAASHEKQVKGRKLISLICGANMDFSKLRLISAHSSVGAQRQKYLRFEIGEQKGTLLGLLEDNFADVSVSAFSYGKVSHTQAWPVIAFEAGPETLDALTARLKKSGIAYEDISQAPDIRYRAINYDPRLCRDPFLLHVHFPERKGALRDLLKRISGRANICYFNYVYTGEEIGRALMAFEIEQNVSKQDFVRLVEQAGVTSRPVDKATAQRMFYVSDIKA